MRNYVIMTDSSCDLPAALAEEMELVVQPLTVNLDGQEYKNYLDGREIGFSEFYTRLRSSKSCSTSAVNINAVMETVSPVLEGGKDVFYVAFSSGLSNTYNVTAMAAQELEERYPGRRMVVVDSKCASMGQGLLVWLCAKARDKGLDLDALRDYAEKMKGKICHWFTVDNLQQLLKGGRISKTVATLGTMLNIKPVLHLDEDGKIQSVSKARGRKSSVLALVDRMGETAEDLAKQTVFISHGDCLEDAQQLAQAVKERYGVKDVVISYIGPVIGAHSGWGTLAVFYVGSRR